jgi:hypothetical protein
MTLSFTVDVHHHILPDVFWRATNDAHSPVGGILPAACRHEVETSTELDGEESRAVLAGNALKLFPRLAARAATEKESAQTLPPQSIS